MSPAPFGRGKPQMGVILSDLGTRVPHAVAHYWTTLEKQSRKGKKKGSVSQGSRGKVVGGKQMDGFAKLIASVVAENGMPEADIYLDTNLEIPGYFRPTKKWDLVIVHDGQLVAAMEFKSQAGPSFGNNFNNRTEEAIGSAHDLLTAHKNGAFAQNPQRPWLGSLVLLEEAPGSTRPVKVKEPHFPVFEPFRDSSYAKRYELMLGNLVKEGLYSSAALLLSSPAAGKSGHFTEPAETLTVRYLLADLAGRIGTVLGGRPKSKS